MNASLRVLADEADGKVKRFLDIGPRPPQTNLTDLQSYAASEIHSVNEA